jgi:hypothetical protein
LKIRTWLELTGLVVDRGSASAPVVDVDGVVVAAALGGSSTPTSVPGAAPG